MFVYCEGGVSLSIAGEDGQGALHLAARHGRMAVAAFLLENRAAVNRRDREGRTPLDIALARGHAEMEALLRAHGGQTGEEVAARARLYLRKFLRFAAVFVLLPILAVAAYGGYRFHLRRWRVDQAKALEKAIERRRHDDMRGIIKENPEVVRYMARRKNTALHVAIWNSNMEAVRFLIENGADPGAPNEEGHRPLHWAAKKGQAETIRLLLEADPWIRNQTEKFGRTALSFAARQGQLEAVETLLRRGAQITSDIYGETPITYAIKENHKEVADLLRQHQQEKGTE